MIQGSTKTKRSRAHLVPSFLRDALVAHVATFSDPKDPEAFVFTAPDGGQLRPNNWRKRVFHPACEGRHRAAPPPA
jgi:hypothetical protein